MDADDASTEEAASASPDERRGTRSRPVLVVLGGALLLGVVSLGIAMATGVGGRPGGVVEANLKVAPDFTLPTFEGQSFTLSDHAQGPIFVYFWASWCVPCRQEAPVIQALWLEYGPRGYTFVGVNMTDLERDARKFIGEFGLTFPLVRDADGAVYLQYGVFGLPEAFFLRPGMEVQRKFIGPLSEEQLRQMLDSLQPGA